MNQSMWRCFEKENKITYESSRRAANKARLYEIDADKWFGNVGVERQIEKDVKKKNFQEISRITSLPSFKVKEIFRE